MACQVRDVQKRATHVQGNLHYYQTLLAEHPCGSPGGGNAILLLVDS